MQRNWGKTLVRGVRLLQRTDFGCDLWMRVVSGPSSYLKLCKLNLIGCSSCACSSSALGEYIENHKFSEGSELPSLLAHGSSEDEWNSATNDLPQ